MQVGRWRWWHPEMANSAAVDLLLCGDDEEGSRQQTRKRKRKENKSTEDDGHLRAEEEKKHLLQLEEGNKLKAAMVRPMAAPAKELETKSSIVLRDCDEDEEDNPFDDSDGDAEAEKPSAANHLHGSAGPEGSEEDIAEIEMLPTRYQPKRGCSSRSTIQVSDSDEECSALMEPVKLTREQQRILSQMDRLKAKAKSISSMRLEEKKTTTITITARVMQGTTPLGTETFTRFPVTRQFSHIMTTIQAKFRLEELTLFFGEEALLPDLTPAAMYLEEEIQLEARFKAKEAPPDQAIVLKIQIGNQKPLKFKVLGDTPFARIIDSIKTKTGKSTVTLLFDGETLGPDDTPNMHDIEDDDCIDARVAD